MLDGCTHEVPAKRVHQSTFDDPVEEEEGEQEKGETQDEAELAHYLDFKCGMIDADELLMFWDVHKEQFPLLSAVAKVILHLHSHTSL